jgi:hypothetical protein
MIELLSLPDIVWSKGGILFTTNFTSFSGSVNAGTVTK